MQYQTGPIISEIIAGQMILRGFQPRERPIAPQSNRSIETFTHGLSSGCAWISGLYLIAHHEPKCAITSDAAYFQQLVSAWHKERGVTSSITYMMLSPSYQRIIGMGERAIPLILRQLTNEGDNPDHWGWALHSITGEDPVPNEAAGDTVLIARAWLNWARQRGHAW
jgi:hypothetical protein